MLKFFLDKLKWKHGRQAGGYQKLKIFESKFFSCDCYLLYYKEGSFIPEHTDPVKKKKHYRLNIELVKPKRGGYFIYDLPLIWKFYRIVLFRPDITIHSVTKIIKGYRLMLSIGWAR